MYVHSNMIHNSFRIDTALMPINWKMDKQDMAHSYKRTLLSHEKKKGSETILKILFSAKEARHKEARCSVSSFIISCTWKIQSGQSRGIESSFSGCWTQEEKASVAHGSYWWHTVSRQCVKPLRQCKQIENTELATEEVELDSIEISS